MSANRPQATVGFRPLGDVYRDPVIREFMPPRIRKSSRHLLLDETLAAYGAAHVPRCFLFTEIGGQTGRDMSLGIPRGHDLHVLNGRVLNSGVPSATCGPDGDG